MSDTGLSADQGEYRRRLDEQSEDQVAAYAAELMRDISIRIGVVRVVNDFTRTTGITEWELERVFAAGGGAPSTIGRTDEGHLMVPAISLHHLVAGIRNEVPDARRRLTDYLVDSFHEFVFI